MGQTDLRADSRDGSRGDAPLETPMDDDDRLRPDFVRQVIACVEAGDDEGARNFFRRCTRQISLIYSNSHHRTDMGRWRRRSATCSMGTCWPK